MKNTDNTSPAINKRKLAFTYCTYAPPKNGPAKLPTLKKILHSKFPVGNSSFGVKSVIYEIPRENTEPQNIPANKKLIKIIHSDDSKKLPNKNIKPPPPSAMSDTFHLPMRSPSVPSGTCVRMPPTENADSVKASIDKSK